MKKIFFLIFILFLICNPIFSQDFKPSTEALSYIDSKNVNVDHSTGIFHYSIPLFEINSGGYSLPISLNYTGRGVKYYSKPGFTGYNWSLNIGGIVTRTIRGGIADEKRNMGIANCYNHAQYLLNDIQNVHIHERDGEHDIFTAVFNGQSVDFIISNADAVDSFKVEPLESTNVKIDYKFEKNEIVCWIVTDEMGVEYTYSEPEWMTSIGKQQPSGIGSVNKQNYISSWHLTQIKAPGCAPIYYIYENPYIEKGNYKATQESDGIKYNESGEYMYIYGKPMLEYPFNFDHYRSDYQNAINNARSSINSLEEEILDQVNKAIRSDIQYTLNLSPYSSHLYNAATPIGGFNPNYFLNYYPGSLGSIDYFMLGILTNLENITSVSQEAIDALNAAISILRSVGTSNTYRAESYLEQAKMYLIQCFSEYRNINHQKNYNVTAYQIFPPRLRSIVSGEFNTDFFYSLIMNEWEYDQYEYKLDSIVVNASDNHINSYIFSMSYQRLLKSLIKIGKDKKTYDEFKFDYHFENIRSSYFTKDKWGDFTLTNSAKQNYDPTLKYNKRFSLAKIENAKGGKISFDYEPNRYYCIAPNLDILIYEYEHFEWFTERYPTLEFIGDYSGIRIKEIISDAGNSQTDVIRYHYPDYGLLMYSGTKEFDRNKYINGLYDRFEDIVLLPYTSYTGYILKEEGNNGLFYNYVEEEISGKGVNNYLYSMPLSINPNSLYPVPFWGKGLLLASASYDINGNIVKLLQNYYYTDKSFYDVHQGHKIGDRVFEQSSWFTEIATSLKYSQSKMQVKPNDYYINEDKAKRQLGQQVSLQGYTINMMSLYNANIQPRLNLDYQPIYNFYYGGKTVLKEQKEYQFTGSISSSPSVNHLTGEVPSGNILLSHIEYIYDNPTAHSNPTRIVNHLSNGVKEITQIRTPLDFKTGTESILEAMKKANMVGIPVKEQLYTEYNGRTELISEGINLYTQLEDGTILPGSSFLYTSSDLFTPSLGAEENKLFTADPSLYKLSNKWEYKNFNNQWYPVSQISLKDTFQFVYDIYNTGLPIFKSDISENSCVKAIAPFEYQKYKINLPAPTYEYEYEREFLEEDVTHIYEYFYHFISIMEDFNPNLLQGHEFLTPAYLESEEFLFMKQYIKNTLNRVRVEVLLEGLDKYNDYIVYVTDFHLLMDFMHFNVENFDYFQMINALIKLLNILSPTPQYYELFPCHYAENLELLRITKSALYNQYRVYCLVYPQEGNLSFNPEGTIIRANNASISLKLSSFTLKPKEWQLITFDLDLSGYSSSDQLDIRSVYSDVAISYGAIVPVGTQFEGTVYNSSRLPIFNLNQNGNFIKYEYDAAGRPTHIYDKDGNLLQEIEYSPLKD